MERRPSCTNSTITTPKAATLIQLLSGSYRHGSVTFTCDEMSAVKKLYEFKPEKTNDPDASLLLAGSNRNAMRHAEQDGLRMLAWIAKYVDPGQDPLKALIQFAIEAGVDVDPADVDYANDCAEETDIDE